MKFIKFLNYREFRPINEIIDDQPLSEEELPTQDKDTDLIFQHLEAGETRKKNLVFSPKGHSEYSAPWHVLCIPVSLWKFWKRFMYTEGGGFSIWDMLFFLKRGEYRKFRYRFGFNVHTEVFDSNVRDNPGWEFVVDETEANDGIPVFRSNKKTPHGFKHMILDTCVLKSDKYGNVQIQVGDTLAVYGTVIIDVAGETGGSGSNDATSNKEIGKGGGLGVRQIIDWIREKLPTACTGGNGAPGALGEGHNGYGGGTGGGGGGGGGLLGFGLPGSYGNPGTIGKKNPNAPDGGEGGAGGKVNQVGTGQGGCGAGGGGIVVIEARKIIGSGTLIIKCRGGVGGMGGDGGSYKHWLKTLGHATYGGGGGSGGGGGGGAAFISYWEKTGVNIIIDVKAGEGGAPNGHKTGPANAGNKGTNGFGMVREYAGQDFDTIINGEKVTYTALSTTIEGWGLKV